MCIIPTAKYLKVQQDGNKLVSIQTAHLNQWDWIIIQFLPSGVFGTSDFLVYGGMKWNNITFILF